MTREVIIEYNDQRIKLQGLRTNRDNLEVGKRILRSKLAYHCYENFEVDNEEDEDEFDR